MKRINILLLDEQEKFVEQYKKENQCGCLDEAINKIISDLKDFIKGKSDKKR